MFPTLGHLLSYLTGREIILGFPTFGFMVAVSFLLAALTLKSELRRLTEAGFLHPVIQKVPPPTPPTPTIYLFHGILGFIIGYKFGLAVTDSRLFFADPARALFSLQGSVAGGILGAALFVLLRYRESKRFSGSSGPTIRPMPYGELVGNITVVAAVSGIIGAKIFHNLEYPQEFLADPVGSLFSQGGLTFYGGLLFGIAAVGWYVWKKGLNPIRVADAAAPGLMLAYGVGRIGCQLSGDGDWGIVNLRPKPSLLSWLPDWMWAYNYPHNVAGEGIPIPGCAGPYCTILPEPVFPTPIYETIAGLFLFSILWALRKRFQRPGLLFSVYMIFNGFERFWIEKIRVNAQYHLGFISLTQAEIISSFLLVGGVAGIFLTRKYHVFLEKFSKRPKNS
ncbi:MAG: prolipoprotein diacylglyceryl transferase [Flavobacteriales bacterium]|nr:prolipoprotein diacylglyceryl transferase [Flavobacteriales bacterium]MCX7769306.1 prolipoprotein diacylglyceryl transferase [Flavobacteriales bacterium]MDW8410496.1 prolipoprotein diacylglyceryl transferase [Flavobacteriales bacterium]